MDLLTMVSGFLGAGGFASLLTYLTTRRKQTIDAETQIRETILKVLEDERRENATCEERVAQLTTRVEELVTQNAALRQQISDLEDLVRGLRETLLATYARA